MELTPERLQSIAVNCVTQFMNKQASLSGAIAKEAQDLELNSEQTKRVIEATNTIAYLRQLEKAADRTFEFPVADFGQVMATMCLPEFDKSASDKEEKDEDDKEDKDKKSDEKEKKDEKSERTFPWSKKEDKDKDEDKDEDKEKAEEQEKVAMLTREFFRAKSNLEKIACEKIGLHLKLSAAASILNKDPQGIEKLAEVVEEDDYNYTLALCGLEKRATENLVFTDKELDPAREVYGLYKEAKELIATEAELQGFVKKAEHFFFEKQAILAALAGGAARLVGATIGGVVRPIAGSIGKGLGNAARNTGSSIGSGIKNFATGTPKAGFTGQAFKKNFTKMEGGRAVPDIKGAVKHFDNLKKTQGLSAAKAHFGGASPNWLVHRDGFNKSFDALTATTIAGSAVHKYNAKDELLP